MNRTGWSALGGGTTYRVRLRLQDVPWQLAHRSAPARAGATIDGRNVSIDPLPGRAEDPNAFAVNVTRGGERLGHEPIPPNGSRIEVGGLGVVREERALIVVRNGTRVQVARKESYE